MVLRLLPPRRLLLELALELPYAAPPIGISKRSEKGGERWWAFPVRRGTDAHYLRPEQLATIMEPRLRRIALQLAALPIPDDRPNPLTTIQFRSLVNKACWIKALDPDAGVVIVELDGRPGKRIAIPLEAVHMVWTDLPTGIVFLAVEGKLTADYDFRWQ